VVFTAYLLLPAHDDPRVEIHDSPFYHLYPADAATEIGASTLGRREGGGSQEIAPRHSHARGPLYFHHWLPVPKTAPKTSFCPD